jgi:hypothetical protein
VCLCHSLFRSLLFDFHIIVPLLQTCSVYKCAYDHVCFVHTFTFWIYLPHVKENMRALFFWPWLILLSMMSSNSIHSLRKQCNFVLHYG